MSTSEFERLVNLRAWSNAVVNQPREEGRDRRVVAGAIGLYQRCTDALRGTGGACQQLRTRRERPHCSRAAEQRDELAPRHSITASARASTVAGKARPSAFAVLRLMTSSYLVGACTGRSAGFSPLRMRST